MPRRERLIVVVMRIPRARRDNAHIKEDDGPEL